jgi:hypothetical protein
MNGWMIRTALVNTVGVMSVQEIVNPRSIVPVNGNARTQKETMRSLQQLKHNLDSLKQSNKTSFYELIKKEPHLLDSLNGLIELYNEQSK